jgi:hypothetical protein
MNIPKFIMASVLTAAAISSQATVIEYNGYSRDTTSNVVQKDNQEWLMWSATLGKSTDWFLNSAEATSLREQGWQLANYDQMNGLFTDFSNPHRKFSASQTKLDGQSLAWQLPQFGGSSTLEDFLTLFGEAHINNPVSRMGPGEIASHFDGGQALAYINDSVIRCSLLGVSVKGPDACLDGRYSVGPTVSTGPAGVRGLALVKAPEPSMLLLLLVGTAGLFARAVRVGRQSKIQK